MSFTAAGLIICQWLTQDAKPAKLIEPPQFDHLAPPGSRTMLHDNSIRWHGDQLHITTVDEWQ